MIAGQGSREQAEARRLAYRDPGLMQALIDRIADCTIDYLLGQIEAGSRRSSCSTAGRAAFRRRSSSNG
jgi:uroporphyrinogen-III decarboxylase